jgi:hypothetical protein
MTHAVCLVLFIVMLNECRYAECRYADFRYAECSNAHFRYAHFRYAHFRYAHFRYIMSVILRAILQCSGLKYRLF